MTPRFQVSAQETKMQWQEEGWIWRSSKERENERAGLEGLLQNCGCKSGRSEGRTREEEGSDKDTSADKAQGQNIMN